MPQMNQRARDWAARLLVIACLLLFFALGLRAALTASPTNDEPAHMLRGYVLATTGGLQYQTGHAPLSHRLIGLLLAADPSVPDPAEIPSWPDGERLQLASELLWQSAVDVDRVLFLARLSILWMGILLGGLIGSWALSWNGRAAMSVSLVLFAASPNLLAAASLATTDFMTVVTYFATIYAWWRTWRSGQRRWWLLTAVSLGLALAAKLTAVLLLPVLFLLTFLFLGRGKPFWRPFLAWLALLPAAGIVLWLVYGLQIGSAAGFPWPLPAAAYVTSWQNVLEHVERGHRAFFLGELSGDGWWSYFPVTFLIKTPLVTMALLIIGLGVILSRRDLWRTALFLLLPVGALFAAAMTSRLNIGYRHILPITPFLLVIAGVSVLLLRRWMITRLLLLLVLLWTVVAAIRHSPHFLAYFNESVGGMAQGYNYLGDSNLDWGQDLKLLAELIEGSDENWIVSYAGVADPAYYGIEEEQLLDHDISGLPFAAANPAPGSYAISANHWQGILADADTFDWFRREAVQRNLGGSILIYQVDAQAGGAFVAHCADPAPLLTPQEAETLLGRSGLRHVWFDCSQSWVLPGGDLAGWYITPQADSWWPVDLMSPESASRLDQVYRHRATAVSPSYDVLYWAGGVLEPDAQRSAAVAQLADGQRVNLPYAASDLAQLTAYQVSDGYWNNLWAITAETGQPVSMRAHLYNAQSESPQVSDGLGYAAEQWRAGDLFWQRHPFAFQEDELYLESGLYDYQTLAEIGKMLRLPLP